MGIPALRSRRRAAPDRPRAALVRPVGEVADETQARESGPDEPVERIGEARQSLAIGKGDEMAHESAAAVSLKRLGRDAETLRHLIHLHRASTIMIWREIDNFSSGAVCLVLASDYYDEDDYYRDYFRFVVDVEKMVL